MKNLFEVLDGGEGIVEVVQQGFPLLVLGGFAEPDGVILQRCPFHEEEVGVRALQAP